MTVKSVGKLVLGILIGLLLTIILVVLFWLGPTVKLVAEQVGIKALGTPLTINKLSINPRKGTIHLTDFVIENQTSFAKSNAVSLASLDIAIDMSSIFTRTVVVHQVKINSPHFIYEQSAASDNITEFMLNIQEFIGADPAAPPAEEKKKKKASKKEPKIVVVECLEINDVQFHLANTEDPLLDVGVGFEQLSISMTNGTVQVDNVYVRNPGRLTSPNLFTLDQAAFQLEPGTIYSSNITINAVQVSNPQAYMEHNPETDTVAEFLKIAHNFISRIPTNAPQAVATNRIEVAIAEENEPASSPAKVILNALTVEGIRVHVVNIDDPLLDVHFGIDSINVALDEGHVSVDNIHFTNPKRLKEPNVFSLENITVDFAPKSRKTDTVVIEDVHVSKLYTFLELHKEANTVSEFMKIADSFSSRIPSYSIPEMPTAENAAQETPKTVEDPSAAPPVELHALLMNDIAVHLLDTTPTNAALTESHILAGIASVSVKLVEGKIQINGITIPNVQGFHATNLFHLANMNIAIEPGSIHSDQVIINEVFVNTPEINLEQTEENGNVATLQTTLMKFAPPSSTPETTKQIAKTALEQDPVPLAELPVVLHSLIVTNLAINLKLPITTNAPAISMAGLSNLNPLNKIPLNKLNPLSGGDPTEEPTDLTAPLPLVAFNRLSVKPLKGLLNIHELHISNPPGFSRHDLVTLDELLINLDPDTLQADTLVIQDIQMSRPRIRYERQIMSDNIKALQKEIEHATIRRDDYIEKEDANETTQEDTEQKVIIEHLLISSGMVRAKLSALPAIPVPLPDIEMKDLGKEKGGSSVTEASTEVFDTFYDSLIGAVSGAPGFAGDAVKGVGSFGLGALGNVVDGVTDGVGSIVSGAETTVEKVKEKKQKRRILTTDEHE